MTDASYGRCGLRHVRAPARASEPTRTSNGDIRAAASRRSELRADGFRYYNVHQEPAARHFCGAGVSRYSGLPLAKDIVGAVLDKLTLDSATRQTLENSLLPFEGFMDALRAEIDDTSLLGIFTIGAFLAKLAALGLVRALYTVNFDCLIEAALEGEGLRAGTDYWITYNDEDFGALDWSDAAQVRLIKVHGSVADPARMAVTLHQVADRQLAGRLYRMLDCHWLLRSRNLSQHLDARLTSSSSARSRLAGGWLRRGQVWDRWLQSTCQ